MNNRIHLILNPNGNTGHPTAQLLLSTGHRVRILARRRTPRVNELADLGAEVMPGSMTHPDELAEALIGVSRVFYCYPIMPGLLENARLFAELAVRNRIEAVVNIGQYLSMLPEHASASTRAHRLSYEVLDQAEIGAIHLTPGWFSVNVLATASFITQLGVLPFPLGNGRTSPVSSDDIARVAVALLLNPEGHVGQRYQPTGGERIGGREMADICARIVGRSVRYLDGMEFVFFRACKFFGLSDYMISQLRYYLRDFRNGVFDYPPNDVVERFTQRPPESFETFARRYFDERGLIARTPGRTLRAFRDFMTIGITRAPSVRQLERLNTAELPA